MTIDHVVDGETELDSALFNPWVDHMNGLQTGALPIALAGIEGALGEYAPLQNIRDTTLYAADFGIVADGDQDNSEYMEELRDAIPATGATVAFPPGEILLLSEVDFSSRPNIRFQGQGVTTFNESASTPYGTSFISGTADMTMLRFGNAAALLHQGPKFDRINFRNGAGGDATLVHLENVNRWGFRDCAWRGYNTSGHDDTGLVIYSNDTTSGGSLAGGDCSWGVLDNCTMSGLYAYGIQSLFTYGFTVLGGEYTLPTNASMYFRGQHIRVLGAKIDGALVDIVSEASFYQINYESARSPGIRVGNQQVFPSGSRNCKGNIIMGAVVGKTPTPAVGIELGQYAEDTVIDAYMSNHTASLSEHASSKGTCVRLPGTTVRTTRNVNSSFAASVENTSNTNGHGLQIEVSGGDASTKALDIDTRSGGPVIDALTVLGDGTVQIVGTYSRPFQMGDYRLWVNPGDGKLYIKSSAPANATDGTVVGAQTA